MMPEKLSFNFLGHQSQEKKENERSVKWSKISSFRTTLDLSFSDFFSFWLMISQGNCGPNYVLMIVISILSAIYFFLVGRQINADAIKDIGPHYISLRTHPFSHFLFILKEKRIGKMKEFSAAAHDRRSLNSFSQFSLLIIIRKENDCWVQGNGSSSRLTILSLMKKKWKRARSSDRRSSQWLMLDRYARFLFLFKRRIKSLIWRASFHLPDPSFFLYLQSSLELLFD